MIGSLFEKISFCGFCDPITFPRECVLLWIIGEGFTYFLVSYAIVFIMQVYIKCIVAIQNII